MYGAGVSSLQCTGSCQALSRHNGVPGCQVLDPDDVKFPPISAHLVDDVTVGRQGGVRLGRAKKARQIDSRCWTVWPLSQPAVNPNSAPSTALADDISGLEPAMGWVGVVESQHAVRNEAKERAGDEKGNSHGDSSSGACLGCDWSSEGTGGTRNSEGAHLSA